MSGAELSIATASAPARAARSAIEAVPEPEVEQPLAGLRRQALDELVVHGLEHRRQTFVHPLAPEFHHPAASGAY